MNDPVEVLVSRVDVLIRLVRAGLIEGKTQREQIELLSRAGLKPKEIAETIDTTPNTVRVELSAMKKRKKRRQQK